MAPEPGTGRTERAWLDAVRAQILRRDPAAAARLLALALAEHPGSTGLRRVLAGVHQRSGRWQDAEAILQELARQDGDDAATAFALAGLLRDQGRTAAAASALRACLGGAANRRDPDLAIHAIELLDGCDRKSDAVAIAGNAISTNPDDPRLHAYAGMLHLQLGDFELARRHDLFALEHDARAWEWHVPIGLAAAQRYDDPSHPDFALFHGGLQRQGLSDLARAELHFSLGKAHDDTGGFAAAAQHLRRGNAILQRLTPWSRKAWRRAVAARLAARPLPASADATRDFVPLFIVGMPRSGTTLLADLLSRHQKVRNRGESPWIARLAERLALGQDPGRSALQDAAAQYAAQLRQDDAGDARWFIDKQPLNFRYLDVMLALFPDARVIHCQRGARDTALSLWMQCFREPVHAYACDLHDIAVVMHDHDRLLAHWRDRFAGSIRTVRYEDLVTAPQATLAPLAEWIGLPGPLDTTSPRAGAGIDTASVWQARQPIHARSVGRWWNYRQHLPAIMDLADS